MEAQLRSLLVGVEQPPGIVAEVWAQTGGELALQRLVALVQLSENGG